MEILKEFKRIYRNTVIIAIWANIFHSNYAYFHTPNELNNLMNSFNVEMLEHISTDGIGPLMSHLVNDLSKEEFDVWVKYHLKICTEPSVLGNSNHALYLCKKKRIVEALIKS